MITQAQCITLFTGLGLLLAAVVAISRWNDRQIQKPGNTPAEATAHLFVGIIILVAAYFVIMWWSDQFQPGGMFLP